MGSFWYPRTEVHFRCITDKMDNFIKGRMYEPYEYHSNIKGNCFCNFSIRDEKGQEYLIVSQDIGRRFVVIHMEKNTSLIM